MRPAGFDDVVELAGLLVECGDQFLGGRHEVADQVQGGDPHRGREDIVGRLGHVDVVVGAHDGIVAALARAGAARVNQLYGTVRQDFVGVHVVARACAGLERVDPEVVDQFGLLGQPSGLEAGPHGVGAAGRFDLVIGRRSRPENLVRGLHYGVAELFGQTARGHVGAGRGLLDLDDRAHEGRMRQRARDREIVDAAGRLDAVVGGVGDFEVPERVFLDAEPDPGSRGSGWGGRSGGAVGRLGLRLSCGGGHGDVAPRSRRLRAERGRGAVVGGGILSPPCATVRPDAPRAITTSVQADSDVPAVPGLPDRAPAHGHRGAMAALGARARTG